jgi:glycosyltransferase involved in cell wall biosynthesis
VPSWYPSEADPVGGVFIKEQADALAARYDVAVLIPEMSSWRDSLKPNLKQVSNTNGDSPVAIYRQSARPLIPHGPERIDYHTFERAAHAGFKKLLTEFGKPDVIHAHVVLPAGWAALKLSRRYSIPIVLTEHSGPFSMHLGTPVQRDLVKKTLNGVDQVIAISPALERQLKNFERNVDVKIIAGLIRTEFFVPATNGEVRKLDPRAPLRFFVVARLVEEKGIAYLLQAASLLRNADVPRFELIIGGDGPHRAELERMAADLGISANCNFLGRLDRAGVRDWMNRSDVFVLPSLGETFGLVVGEAMACGKPVISTRCGGPEFIVTDETGVLVDVANPESLGQAMSDFLNGRVSFDPATIRKSVVERFGVEAFLRNITSVYEAVW